MEKKCIICGFDKKVANHHLQKYLEFGSDDKSNLIYLCPNHHWIADFGDEEDKTLLLKEIKRLTNKEPVIDYDKKKYYEKLIKAFLQDGGVYIINTDEEWKDAKKSYGYYYARNILNSRSGSPNYQFKQNFIDNCELMYLKQLIEKKRKKLYKKQKEFLNA